MMKLSYGLPVVLLGTAAVIVQHQVAVAQTPAEVNAIAKQITVRIDGANTGTGVIINHQGNTYTVVTNEHVVRLKGNYTIQTPDGRRYNFNQNIVKYFPGVDLAELQFNSTENYRTPELGNSQQLSEGTTIYVAGWSDPDNVSPERSYTFLSGGISRIVRNAKNGYALVHTNPTKPGMSGGPVLDMLGRLVGINGLSLTNPGTGATDYFGIPINAYLKLTSTVSVNSGKPPASVNPPPQVGTSSQPISVALATANSSFTILTKALQDTGLTDTMKGMSSFTLFAPTDAAFAKIVPQNAVRDLLKPENKAVLVKILKYHIVPRKVFSRELQSGELKTVQGEPISVRVKIGGDVMLNDGKLVQPDIKTNNGVIHVIDQLILPPSL